MLKSKRVSIIVPSMNEEENVDRLYAAITGVTNDLPQYQWEYLLVDDGSTDQTFSKMQQLAEKDPRVKILQLSRNFGSYQAIRAGMDYAQGDAVITISADLQDSPELFRSFVAKWEEGYDIVWGVRAKRDDPWSKTLLANLFYRVVRFLALTDLPRDGMDCGLFDRRVIEEFCRIPDINNITFMTIYWMGFRQARIPYHRLKREFGETKWPIGKRIKAALDVVTSFSGLPLRFASFFGILISTLSLIGAVIIIFNKIVFGIGSWGWPSMMVSILFLGGVQLIVLGVIGEYLWRIGNQVRGKPPYIVMRKVGFEDSLEPKGANRS